MFQLHLTQLLVTAFGEAATSQVSVAIHSVEGRDVARIHAEPSTFPILQEVKTNVGVVRTLYVRLGNGTRAVIDPAEVDRYIAVRWRAG